MRTTSRHKAGDGYRYGRWVFSVRISGGRLRHLLLGCARLVDVPVEQIRGHHYSGGPQFLVLDGGRRVRIYGLRAEEFARLTKDVQAMRTLSAGLESR